MADELASLLESLGIEFDGELKEFTPGILAVPGLGMFMYLQEDCSYRACMVSETMGVLLDAHEDRVVGLQFYERPRLLT